MRFHSLFRSVRRGPKANRTRRFVPTLTALEDRAVPSTLVVKNNNDSGLGSLRQAMTDAKSGDTIAFAPSVHLIKLTSGELDTAKALTIAGPGAALLTVSGSDASRVFHLESGADLRISGLTLTRGRAGAADGGDAPGGGAIRNEAGANLTLAQAVLTGNQAVGVVGLDEFGGAVFNTGRAVVTDCVFTDNQAIGGGSLTALGGSAGGAIDNYGGATLTVTNTTFRNNRAISAAIPAAVSAAGGVYFAIGGAVDSNAGVNGFDPAQARPSTATLTNCAILNNLATGGAEVTGNGGGISSSGIGSTMNLTGCVIDGNRSVGGDGGGNNASQGDGGGVMNVFGPMTITNCVITNNQAVGGNNAVISPAFPQSGSAYGAGVQNNVGGALTITGSVIAGNVARGGATATGPGGIASGAGISNSPGFAPGGTLTVRNTSIVGNRAIAGRGGPGGGTALAGVAFGAGIDTSGGSTSTLDGCIIAGNIAQGGAGGAGTKGGDALGGGLSVGQVAYFLGQDDTSRLTVNRCLVIGNQALGGAGGQGAAGGDGKGGGLFVFSRASTPGQASAAVTASLITGNAAIGGPGGAGGSAGRGIGGGIYNDHSTVTLDGMSLVFANFASTSNNNIFP